MFSGGIWSRLTRLSGIANLRVRDRFVQVPCGDLIATLDTFST